MTMMQKVQAKRSKKGFTLVELVIVIAILAILAAIAIPVITTTINSSKLSVMESDTATLNMLIKECQNNYKAEITTTTYGTTKPVTAAEATLSDICESNGLPQGVAGSKEEYYSRTIGGKTYNMVWKVTSGTDGSLEVQEGGTAVNASWKPADNCTK